MDLSTLDMFCAVAQEQSITRVAQQLGRAQSNVTTRIQQLEQELDATLFLRTPRRLILTGQGEIFLVHAREMLALAEKARQQLHSDVPQGLLRLGTMESTAASRLPQVLARYHSRWPKVQLRVTSGTSRELFDAVAAREQDGVLVAHCAATEELPRRLALASEVVFTEQLVLVLPADHPPVQGAADLQVSAWASFRPGCSYRDMAQDWIHETGPTPHALTIHEVGSYHATIACVAAGDCMAIVPQSVLALFPMAESLRQHPVRQVDTHLFWREGDDTPALRALRTQLTTPDSPPMTDSPVSKAA